MFKKIISSAFFILFFAFNLMAQNATIQGTITDNETGDVIPGANLVLMGHNMGAASDAQGEYEIRNVPAGSYTLRVTFIGYKTKKIRLSIDEGESLTKDVALEASTLGLDEVVVSGYTDVSRKRLTGSVSTVSSDQLENIPVATFIQKLQGQLPGIFISTGSGQPGSAPTVRIRGSASITGDNDPLYVLDGIPITGDDYSTISNADIKSISVLKDASATAEYGSRGSNGVVQITTKRGEPGPTKVQYTGKLGVSVPGDLRFDMMNASERLKFQEIMQDGKGWKLSDDNPNQISNAEAMREQLLQKDHDWTKIFFRHGISRSHHLNISGGTEDARYFVSGNILNKQGIAQRSDLDRYNIHVNTEINANDNIQVGFLGQGGYSESSFIESESAVALANPYAAAYLAVPFQPLRDDQGNVDVGQGHVGPNAYARLNNSTDDQAETRLIGKIYGSYSLKNVEAKQTFSMDYIDRDYSRFVEPDSYVGNQEQNGGDGSLNKATDETSEFRSLTSLTYENTFNNVHYFKVYAANEFTKYHFDSFGFTGYGLNSKLGDTPASITPGSPDNNEIPSTSGGISEHTLWSIFGIANYSYNDKYNFKATLRRDGSSRFGTNDKYGLFWSLGGSWIASSEDFLADVDAINNLKVRLSYGKTGNQEGVGNYQNTATFAIGNYAGESTLVPSTVGNSNLKWETTYELNLGIDFSLFDRLSGTVDLYNNKTTDEFITQNLSRTTGFLSLSKNAGKMRNRGLEVSLSGDVIQTKNTILTLNVNYSFNKNEILDLGQVNKFEQGTSIIKEGLSLGTHYIVGWAGVDPATGAPLYYDSNGNVTDHYSSSYSQASYGTWLAPVNGGFGFDFTWKNLTVGTTFNYTYGNNIFNNQSYFLESPSSAQFNQKKVMLNIWQKPGDITNIQSADYARQFSSKDIEDGSYLRFRNLTISYTLPSKIFNNQIGDVRIFAKGRNLYTWTAFTGFDPEEGNNIEQFSYPLPRTYTTGIEINF